MTDRQKTVLQDFCSLFDNIYGVFKVQDIYRQRDRHQRDYLMGLCDNFWSDPKNAAFCRSFFEEIGDTPDSDRQAAAFGYCVQFFGL